MKQNTLIEIISDQTQRMLWEVNNVIDCVPNILWNKEYCDMPLWKHIYHMLHFRHLHTHMGMLMGFVIDDAGLWPNVLGLTRPIPQNGDYNKYC